MIIPGYAGTVINGKITGVALGILRKQYVTRIKTILNHIRTNNINTINQVGVKTKNVGLNIQIRVFI